MQDSLTTAVEAHRAGRLVEATQLYKAILAEEPTNTAAWQLLGVVNHQQCRYVEAVACFSQAIAREPQTAAFHVGLAEAQRALGQFERSEASCRAAIGLQADHCDAICTLGLALRGLGRIDEALVQLQQVVTLDPNFVRGHISLGRLLLEISRPAEALPHLQWAVQASPRVAELHRNLANALHGLGRLSEARAAYLSAIALDPQLGPAQANLALLLEQEGQLDEALRRLTVALELEPGNAVYLQQLAKLHERRQDPLEAAKCWDALATIPPRSARGHVVVGQALEKQRRGDEAVEHYRQALKLQPDLAEAYDRLGNLYQDLGEKEEAERAIRASQRLRPQASGPYGALALLLGAKLPSVDFEALVAHADNSQLDDESRAHLLFALAHVLDAREEYAQAADHSRRANALTFDYPLRRTRREHAVAQHVRFVDGVLHAFDAEFYSRVRGAGLTTMRPVFVFGLPRSGTSLVEQILASHPDVYGAGELFLGPQTFEAIPTVVRSAGSPLDCVNKLDAGSISRLAARHLDGLHVFDGGRNARIVDKSPQNYQLIGLLATLFPRATFIHCRRDLRDVALSCWLTEFNLVDWAQDVEHIASRFEQHLRMMHHWRSVLPIVMHEVRYEQTVADLEGVARGLVAACRLEWNPACLDFHLSRRAVRTASAMQVRQPIYSRSVGRWKHYEPYLSDLFAHLPVE
jgi:tetratricopeptide (TPR) repeat protein